MITIDINGKKTEAIEGEPLLKTLERVGVQVPTLCYMKDRFPSGACRMCVVEVEGQQNLIPSCAYPASDGMKIQTHSPRVLRARKTIVELLLANHPDDCLYCVRNGLCELQGLAEGLDVRQRRFTSSGRHHELDSSSEAIIRDQAKCILCGRCVRTCEEIMTVSAIDFIGRGSNTRIGTAFDEGMNISTCISCGQCILACPTGALREQTHVKSVMDALADPGKTVVIQHAPAVSVTLGELFGLPPGKDCAGLLVAALRQLGFNYVFDTGFAADLTIMEEGSELVQRLQPGASAPLPMMTSCSPGWINFVEEFYPSFIPHLSSCKSPQQMLGALIKSWFAEKNALKPADIFSVSIMPCTAKKGECARPELRDAGGNADVDAVLTTRELARIIRQRGIDLNTLVPDTADTLFGQRSTAGKLFGVTGGVMEAAVRTAHFLVTGKEMAQLELKAVRGLEGIKEATIPLGKLELKVAVVSGLANARKLLEDLEKGLRTYHFIEVMTCPGGCIGGGGQPHYTELERIKARMQALYEIDSKERLRVSHKNPGIERVYREFLGAPLGARSHALLHTHYHPRSKDRG